MPRLQVYENKTLKLTNVLSFASLENDVANIPLNMQQMESYIRIKGAQPVGPVVQHSELLVDEFGETHIRVWMMRQCTNMLTQTDFPYIMKPVLRVKNCLYLRYCGLEENFDFAYDKMKLYAYEEDIILTGESYTVFINRDDQLRNIVVDIFMPKAE